ncbi:MAG: hypothetical protein ACI8XX_001321 [Polaribacter sp.]
MFWRKKKTASFGFDGGSDDRRETFRVTPNAAAPVLITIKGDSFEVVNISGGGVCMRTHNFLVGTVAPATVRLPSGDGVFPVSLEVVMKQGDFCRCRFNQIHREAEELLHAYILDLQKVRIRLDHSH